MSDICISHNTVDITHLKINRIFVGEDLHLRSVKYATIYLTCKNARHCLANFPTVKKRLCFCYSATLSLPGCITCGEKIQYKIADVEDTKRKRLSEVLEEGIPIRKPDDSQNTPVNSSFVSRKAFIVP